MSAAARRASEGSIGTRTVQGLLIATISAALLWLVWVYGNSLRDPRYLDGWLLTAGMSFQLYFHIAIKRASLSPKSAKRWRKCHIFLGYLLIAIFISHSNFSFPDTGLEWMLWLDFVMVTVSGIFGTYLAWSVQVRHGIDETIDHDRILTRRTELQQQVHDLVVRSEPASTMIPLPALPHDAWIRDLHIIHLQPFLSRRGNLIAHLIGSKRPLKRVTDEIEDLSRFVDAQAQEKLAAILNLVIEKDRLDFARVYLGLSKGWLFVHVPITYSLVVLTLLHVLVVYSYSSGLW